MDRVTAAGASTSWNAVKRSVLSSFNVGFRATGAGGENYDEWEFLGPDVLATTNIYELYAKYQLLKSLARSPAHPFARF
jgi:hypothetical protein